MRSRAARAFKPCGSGNATGGRLKKNATGGRLKKYVLARADEDNDSDDHLAVDRWLAGGPGRRSTITVVKKVIHQGAFNFKAADKDAQLAVADLHAVA